MSFAALTMNKDIGLTAWAYGLSSTAFYLGYCLFEVPSNVILDKVGARFWHRTHHDHLGPLPPAPPRSSSGRTASWPSASCWASAEAGLFPGIVLLFTYWFPDHIGPASSPASPWPCRSRSHSARRSPPRSSGWMASSAMPGWKWIYIMEAIPTVLIGVFVLFAMTDKPAKAKWLTARRRTG